MQWSVCRNHNGTEVKYYKYADQYGADTGIEYLAVREPDGSFTVATHEGDFNNVPYVGEYDNYRKMDADAKYHKAPYVCHVAHNVANAYVLIAQNRSYYIRVE